MLNFILKSALFTFLIKKFKKEINRALKSIFILILIIFFYTDIVELFIILDKKNILVYLLAIKWLLILIIFYLLYSYIKSIFLTTIKHNEEIKIDQEIIDSSNRPSQTEEVLDNFNNNISNNETKQTHSKDDILKKDKLKSLGDIILEKHKK
jgi:hypothetical protein